MPLLTSAIDRGKYSAAGSGSLVLGEESIIFIAWEAA
jgi:hypothetical protein